MRSRMNKCMCVDPASCVLMRINRNPHLAGLTQYERAAVRSLTKEASRKTDASATGMLALVEP